MLNKMERVMSETNEMASKYTNANYLIELYYILLFIIIME